MSHYGAFIESDDQIHFIKMVPKNKPMRVPKGIKANAISTRCNKCGTYDYDNQCQTCDDYDITEIAAEEMQRMADEKLLKDAQIEKAMRLVNIMNE